MTLPQLIFFLFRSTLPQLIFFLFRSHVFLSLLPIFLLLQASFSLAFKPAASSLEFKSSVPVLLISGGYPCGDISLLLEGCGACLLVFRGLPLLVGAALGGSATIDFACFHFAISNPVRVFLSSRCLLVPVFAISGGYPPVRLQVCPSSASVAVLLGFVGLGSKAWAC